MGIFKKDKPQEKMPEELKVENINLTSEKKHDEQPQVTIEEVALSMTEHQFKAYVIAKLEEITERLR
jgi:hypothetical protein